MAIESEGTYLDDSREEPVHELAIFRDDQGDIYVMVRPVGHKMGPSVRLCASGGAGEKNPRLLAAMREAHAALTTKEGLTEEPAMKAAVAVQMFGGLVKSYRMCRMQPQVHCFCEVLPGGGKVCEHFTSGACRLPGRKSVKGDDK